ncbi:Lipase member H [Pseudolycoriella hygida]|uniref:Lipase member H n=1 Tax=Pseudolycoriella hygida TaxID=35572 RepID=A0A9Q0MQP4_9DIPT|nr:Lipase member H [Pseudolycoriella hygida]KAJ6647589.1 Lipase member H [Pseudolycoriella hygida]
MKFEILAITLLAASVGAVPLRTDEANDWQLISDVNGRMHIVDLTATDMEAEPLFNAYNDVVFRLFTRSNPTTPEAQIIRINNNEQLANSFFNVNHPTRFHVHGWNGGGQNTGASIRNAFLNRGDNFNVFTVDWGIGATTPNYILARNRVNDAGNIVAQFIDFLNAYGLSFNLIGLIGHSLGAQVAGAAGKRTSRGIVASIVGLDPAGPLFSLDDPANRLHHTDAQYVECHVTDGGRLGFQHPVGHANFYPNWGIQQPGCGPDLTGQCGHSLATTFMVESINPANIFGASRCRDLEDIRARQCVISGPSRRLGGEPVQDGPAIVGSVYFLATNAASPFAQGPR